MQKGLNKYKMAYRHLWQTYGSTWQVRLSYVLQIITRLCKLVALPVAISLIISRLSTKNFAGAKEAVIVFAAFSLTLGILTPLVKYVGMLGENKIYRSLAADYFSRLITANLDYFNSNLSGYLTTATRGSTLIAAYNSYEHYETPIQLQF